MVKHYIPETLKEALELLSHNDKEIIAGGTDLMVQRRTWADTSPSFKSTINIMNIKELDYIKETNTDIIIGSTTSLTDVLKSEVTPKLLKKTIEEIASPALRNVATIAGNIGNASPAGDTLPILYVLDASIRIINIECERTLPIEEVILGPRKTVLEPNEIIKEIIIPKDNFTSTTFTKVGGRKADAISKLSFTGAVTKQNGFIEDVRIAFGAVGPTIVRRKEIENHVIGKTSEEVKEIIPQLLKEYEPFIRPIDDQRSNKIYRKKVSLNLLKEFLNNL